jgi:hypothetical protein
MFASDRGVGDAIHRYCAPIFISDEFGLLLGDPVARDERTGVARMRNATMTFISINNSVYGITCRHVIQELERQQAFRQRDFRLKSGFEPPGNDFLRLYGPKENSFIHINHRFFKHQGDHFTGDHRDIAIARLSHSLLQRLGKSAFHLGRASFPESLDMEGLCGLAAGFPEESRSVLPQTELLNTLRINFTVIVAKVEGLSSQRVQLFGKLLNPSPVDNLSGMSGGPILWSHEGDWGLAGIVKHGQDVMRSGQVVEDLIFDAPTVWIEGEPIGSELLQDLVGLVPVDDQPLTDYSRTLLVPTCLDDNAT